MSHLEAFRVNWTKVIASSLPSFLRKPLIMAILMACLSPVTHLYDKFMRRRSKNLYKIQHNGQVCSLLGVLEEQYPSTIGVKYKIEDVRQHGKIVYTHSEGKKDVPIAVPEAKAEPLLTSGEVKRIETSRFLVFVPEDVYDKQLSDVQWLVQQYKLPTKHPIFIRLER